MYFFSTHSEPRVQRGRDFCRVDFEREINASHIDGVRLSVSEGTVKVLTQVRNSTA